MAQNGMSFAVPRAWCSYGGADSNANANINNARAAGLPYVDVYMFPCRGKSATDQVNQMMASLGVSAAQFDDAIPHHPQAKGMSAGSSPSETKVSNQEFNSTFAEWRAANVVEDGSSNGANFGMVWIDVEENPSSGCSWTSYSWDSNCNYLNDMIN
jgi:hypothetical protein